MNRDLFYSLARVQFLPSCWIWLCHVPGPCPVLALAWELPRVSSQLTESSFLFTAWPVSSSFLRVGLAYAPCQARVLFLPSRWICRGVSSLFPTENVGYEAT